MIFVNKDTGRGLVEVIFSILVILIIAGIFLGVLGIHLKNARSVAIENQLTNLKESLELYRILEGHYPEDLRGLNKKQVIIKEDSLYGRKYLELQTQDEEGYPIDPYGRRFIYDNRIGAIKRNKL